MGVPLFAEAKSGTPTPSLLYHTKPVPPVPHQAPSRGPTESPSSSPCVLLKNGSVTIFASYPAKMPNNRYNKRLSLSAQNDFLSLKEN